MAKMKANPYNWSEVKLFLKGEDYRRIGHNTIVVSEKHQINIIYHNTSIVEFFPNHTKYFSGGWRTSTTKQRINEFLPPGYGLFQRMYDWFISKQIFTLEKDIVIPWEEGFTIELEKGRD